MAFSTTVQTASREIPPQTHSTQLDPALLGMVMLSVYAAQKSKKSMRRMKRKFMWTAFKLKVKSFFTKPTSDQTLIYILIGAVLLALLIVAPVAALVVLLALLILYLLGVLKF